MHSAATGDASTPPAHSGRLSTVVMRRPSAAVSRVSSTARSGASTQSVLLFRYTYGASCRRRSTRGNQLIVKRADSSAVSDAEQASNTRNSGTPASVGGEAAAAPSDASEGVGSGTAAAAPSGAKALASAKPADAVCVAARCAVGTARRRRLRCGRHVALLPRVFTAVMTLGRLTGAARQALSRRIALQRTRAAKTRSDAVAELERRAPRVLVHARFGKCISIARDASRVGSEQVRGKRALDRCRLSGTQCATKHTSDGARATLPKVRMSCRSMQLQNEPMLHA